MGGFTGGSMRALVITIAWSLLAIGGGAPTSAAGTGLATIATGDYHTCAVGTNGTVWCWGLAGDGQLGDGTTGDANGRRSSPVEVLRGASGLRSVTKVAAGARSSCAVRSNGTAWCWGDASQGQLGNGQSGPGERQTSAVQVRRGSGDLTAVTQIATSSNHVCALRSNGSVYCWGSAAFGQVGDGTVGEGIGHVRDTAARVRRGSGFLDKVVAIATGYQHSCAVRRDGSVWCWGDGPLWAAG